jgi:hypothetical protein
VHAPHRCSSRDANKNNSNSTSDSSHASKKTPSAPQSISRCRQLLPSTTNVFFFFFFFHSDSRIPLSACPTSGLDSRALHKQAYRPSLRRRSLIPAHTHPRTALKTARRPDVQGGGWLREALVVLRLFHGRLHLGAPTAHLLCEVCSSWASLSPSRLACDLCA